MRQVGGLPVVWQWTNAPSCVTSLLAWRLKETTFTDMVMWLDCPMPPDKAGIVVAFTPQGAFALHLLKLIEGIEIGGQRYRRLPEWDGSWGSDKDGCHTMYLVVEMSAGARPLPFMTRDVRFVFGDGR
ncbi:MAG: hypothetical protein AAB579_02700 [Patescibacteria group bacterium]